MGKILQRVDSYLFYLLLLFLPTQLGKHFWPDFSIVAGIRVDYLSPTLYLTDVIITFLFIVWSIQRVQATRFKVQSSKLQIFSAVCLFLSFNIFLTHNILNGFYHLLKFLEISFLAYYVSIKVQTTLQVKRAFLFLGIGVIGESLLTMAQVIHHGSLGGIFYFLGERFYTGTTPGIANASINGALVLRPYGTFSHPNVLAGFLLCVMVGLLFSLPVINDKKEKLVWISALLLGSSALLLTFSRITNLLWISMLSVVFIQQIKLKKVALLAFGFLVIVFGVILFVTPFGSRILQTSFVEESVVQRAELIRSSTQLFISHPFFGVGFGNFLPSLALIQKPLSLTLYLQPVHNIFLLVLDETGVVGLGIFIWFLVATYKRLFGMIRKTGVLPYRVFVMLLSLVLLTGLGDHYWLTLQQGQLLFALIVGLSWVRLRS